MHNVRYRRMSASNRSIPYVKYYSTYTIYCIQLYILWCAHFTTSFVQVVNFFCEILYNNHNTRRSHETVIFSCRSSFSGLQTHKTGENSYYVYENRLYVSFSVYETSRSMG